LPSIKLAATLYVCGVLPAFLIFIYLTQFSWVAAFVAFFAYALAGPIFFRCPRCGLTTSARIWRWKKYEWRSPLYHSPNPKHCSRCGLDFRLHKFGKRLDRA
jgi:hypothetical protein